MHSITYFCSPHLSSFCPDDGTCIGTETLVIKVFSTSEEFLKLQPKRWLLKFFSTSEEFLKQEMDQIMSLYMLTDGF